MLPPGYSEVEQWKVMLDIIPSKHELFFLAKVWKIPNYDMRLVQVGYLGPR